MMNFPHLFIKRRAGILLFIVFPRERDEEVFQGE
jgi:hypothetical protein